MRVVKLFYSSVLMTVFLGCKPVNSNSDSSINNQSKSVENATSEEQPGDAREDGVEDVE